MPTVETKPPKERYRRRKAEVEFIGLATETDAVLAGIVITALEAWGKEFAPGHPLHNPLAVMSVRIGKKLFHNPQPKELK
jgi:hypothetical protein